MYNYRIGPLQFHFIFLLTSIIYFLLKQCINIINMVLNKP